MDQVVRPLALAELRALIAPLEWTDSAGFAGSHIGFGTPDIDNALPGGGLARGAIHEVAGSGAQLEHGGAAGRFVGGIVGRLNGPVLWVMARREPRARALAGVGLDPGRLILVVTRDRDTVLAAFEEGLRHRGLAAVVAEIETALSLTDTRRLQLAAEASGVTGFAFRRGRKINEAVLSEPISAVTRWRVTALPREQTITGSPRRARRRWQLDLVRVRGGKSSSWIVEACDAQGRIGLAAKLADGSSTAPESFLAAG
jgi:protein ImuA